MLPPMFCMRFGPSQRRTWDAPGQAQVLNGFSQLEVGGATRCDLTLRVGGIGRKALTISNRSNRTIAGIFAKKTHKN